MADNQSADIGKLEKIRDAWQPVVEYWFGEAVPETEFAGFQIVETLASPTIACTQANSTYRYTIQIPAKSLTNDVMLLADVVQALCSALYPLVTTEGEEAKTSMLYEGLSIYAAVAALNRVFGEGCVGEYLNALREQAISYYDAFSHVSVLMSDDPEVVKKLRAVQPFLNQLSKADFDSAGIDIDRKEKDILLLTFRK